MWLPGRASVESSYGTDPYSKCRSAISHSPSPACRTRNKPYGHKQKETKCSTSSTVGPTAHAPTKLCASHSYVRNETAYVHVTEATCARAPWPVLCTFDGFTRSLKSTARSSSSAICRTAAASELPSRRCDAGEVSVVACPRSPHTALRIDI